MTLFLLVINKTVLHVWQGDGDSFFQTPPKSTYTVKIHNNMVIAKFKDSLKFLDVNTGQQVGQIFCVQWLIELKNCDLPQVHEISSMSGQCCYGKREGFILPLVFAIYSDRKLETWWMNSAFNMTVSHPLRFPL